MSFTNTPPNWQAIGVTPPASIQRSGFTSGYKPPAEYFNWFWTTVSKCLSELQKVINELGIEDIENLQATLDGLQSSINTLNTTAGTNTTNISNLQTATSTNTTNISNLQTATSTNTTNITTLQGKSGLEVGKKSGTQNGEIFNNYTNNHATGSYAHASGESASATGRAAFVHGKECEAQGDFSHVSGQNSLAYGENTFVHGKNCSAGSDYTYVSGQDNIAYNTNAGGYSFVHGIGLGAYANQVVFGAYNTEVTDLLITSDNSAALLIGCGIDADNRANIFRVSRTGKVYGLKAFETSGADYAEMFEWQDGNPNEENRRGLFVTLDGEKIRIANADDYIIGAVSANPSVVGDVQSEQWKDRYLTDIFGSPIYETVKIDGEEVIRQAINPDYDPTKPYINRETRKEWAAVGLLGKLVVIDDGTCQPNGYCKVADGGTATTAENGYRVLSRLDDNHIRIFLG